MKENDAGPVLETGPLTEKIIFALREDNPRMEVIEEVSYKRILAQNRCMLRRETVERVLGKSFDFPQALEQIMPSFKGRISISDDEVIWSAG